MKLLRFLLFPFAVVYDSITRIRNAFFDLGIFTSTSFKTPIIAVGNLSVGGTGKTPQIEYLVRLLKNNYKVAILSRGYKRKTKGFILINKTHNAIDVGDEPLQYFKKFDDVSVAVDANRVNGILELKKSISPEVILLDDAYQHRKVKANCYVLLTKYQDLFVDDFLLPTGNLRESKKGANRAAFIIVTKCPADLQREEQQKIIAKLNPKPNQKVFFSTINYAKQLKGALNISIENLQEYEVLLVTGIANPSPLLKFLSQKKINSTHLRFSDHHQFSAKDIEMIKTTYQKIPSEKKLILTTEKDFVRLENKLENLSYLSIETDFLDGTSEVFNKKILGFLD